MKTRYLLILLLVILSVGLGGCKPEPEFYINGRPYYTRETCTDYVTKTKIEYHYGYWMGKYQYHYGPHVVTSCVSYRTDTLEIKP